MGYCVNLTARAQSDLTLLFASINAGRSAAAFKWYVGLRQAILSLEETPNRCPKTPENQSLRHLLYGHKPHIYRVIYRVIEKIKCVDVLHIRHGARLRYKRKSIQNGSK